MLERFSAKIARRGVGDCWPWIAGKNSHGYGTFWMDGSLHLAHRLAVVFDGRKIPDGMQVDHTCRNRLCCNPEHLRIVTPRQNSLENSESVAATNAAKTHCVHGHAFTPENTAIWDGARRCKQCNRDRVKAAYYAAK